jgi:putative transposase
VTTTNDVFSNRVQGCPKTLAPTPKRSRLRSSAGLDDLDDNILGSEFVGQRLRKTFLYGILFRAAAETLRTIAADPKHLGAEIGFFAVLHTWGSNLFHHPHLHCVVTGGGLSADGTEWISCRNGFFLPVRVLSRLFRRLFLEKLVNTFDAWAYFKRRS